MEFSKQPRLKTLFVHLTATYGGAERLILSLAEAFKAANCEVTLGFVQYSKEKSFHGFSKFPIFTFGNFIPTSLCGHFIFWCSIIRLVALTLYIWWKAREKYDVAVGDQLALLNPILKLQARKVVFYLHFPEPLQAKQSTNFIYLWYRKIITALDSFGLDFADEIWVNSKFTKSSLLATYPALDGKKVHLIYPSVTLLDPATLAELRGPQKERAHFISVNRFEIKKNIPLAVESYASFLRIAQTHGEPLRDIKLKICGRYDDTVPNSVKSLQDTRDAIGSLPSDVRKNIEIMTDISEVELLKLLSTAIAVIYTPVNEHFGIVPLEGMAAGTPVIAVDNGGPTETILHHETGSLVTPDRFGQELLHWARNNNTGQAEPACLRRAATFSFENLSHQIRDRLRALSIKKL